MKNIKSYTFPIKPPFSVFQNLTLNFGPFKRTLSITSHCMVAFLSTSEEVVIVMYMDGGFIDIREME